MSYHFYSEPEERELTKLEKRKLELLIDFHSSFVDRHDGFRMTCTYDEKMHYKVKRANGGIIMYVPSLKINEIKAFIESLYFCEIGQFIYHPNDYTISSASRSINGNVDYFFQKR